MLWPWVGEATLPATGDGAGPGGRLGPGVRQTQGTGRRVDRRHGQQGHPQAARVSYRLTGGGSAVMETLFAGTDMEMLFRSIIATARSWS